MKLECRFGTAQRTCAGRLKRGARRDPFLGIKRTTKLNMIAITIFQNRILKHWSVQFQVWLLFYLRNLLGSIFNHQLSVLTTEPLTGDLQRRLAGTFPGNFPMTGQRPVDILSSGEVSEQTQPRFKRLRTEPKNPSNYLHLLQIG